MIDFADPPELPALDPPPKQGQRPARRCDCGQLIKEGTIINGQPLKLGDPCPFCGLALESTHALARGNQMLPKTRPGRNWGDVSFKHGTLGYKLGCRCVVCCAWKVVSNERQRVKRQEERVELMVRFSQTGPDAA